MTKSETAVPLILAACSIYFFCSGVSRASRRSFFDPFSVTACGAIRPPTDLKCTVFYRTCQLDVRLMERPPKGQVLLLLKQLVSPTSPVSGAWQTWAPLARAQVLPAVRISPYGF